MPGFVPTTIPVSKKNDENVSAEKFEAKTTNYVESVRNCAYEATLVVKGDLDVKICDKINLTIRCKDGSTHFASGTYLVIGKVDQIEGDFTTTLKLQKENGAYEGGVMNYYASYGSNGAYGAMYGGSGGSGSGGSYYGYKGSNNLSYSQIQARYMNLGYVTPFIHDSGMGAEIANRACQYIGKILYNYGSKDINTGYLDCSGFVCEIYRQFGINLPDGSANLATVGRAVDFNNEPVQAGDIVCYSGHVNIYVGDGKCVAARSASLPRDQQLGYQSINCKPIKTIRRVV